MTLPIRSYDAQPYRRATATLAPHKDEELLHEPLTRIELNKLRESVWHSSNEAIRITDSDGVIVDANGAYCRFAGMGQEELIGKDFAVVYDRSIDPSILMDKHKKRFKERSIEPLAGRQIHFANGKVVFAETSNAFIEGCNVQTFLLSIFRDTTERRQLEQALERERGLLRTVINNLPDRIFAKDIESKFIINNEAHLQALGVGSQVETTGKTDFDFRPRDLAEQMFRDDREVIDSGKRIVEKEERAHDQSGKATRLLVTKVPMCDRNGGVIGLVGISRDVTRRFEAEEALKESERAYHELFNNAVQGMFRSTVKGKLLTANAALIRMLGYDSFEELASLNLADVYANPDERRAHSLMLSENGVCSNVALTLKRRDGVIIHALEHSRAIRDAAGNVIAFEGILEDISERRALETRVQEHLSALKTSQESLAELNDQKDRLFSILSHDLRSPFTSILGFCEILLDANENVSETDRNDFIGHIQNSARLQMALLNKLLIWSRLETGRIKFDVKDVDLSAIVAASVSSHLGIARQKEITLQSNLPPLMKARGDEVMVTQVFNNLISNALKFTPAHGLISIDLLESKEDQWILAVRDTGAGIPKDDFKKLFKIEENFSRKGLAGEEGTGLGLSVVHEILKKHSGAITVQSVVGQGTTFVLRFPRLMENIEQSALVVDDDEGVRVLHSRYLKRIFPDSRIIQASNGKEALELAKRYHPRLIVTDYSMPEMNGFEFLSQLRQEPTTTEIPVFVITGKDSTASMEAMRLSGAAAVLTKPVSSTQLQSAIEKFMADRI